MAKPRQNILVTDFDFSMIDVCSDLFIFEDTNTAYIIDEIRKERANIPLPKLMDQKLLKLQKEHKVTRKQIEEAMAKMPFPKGLEALLKKAKAKGAFVIIVSAGNDFFIEAFLKANKFDKYVDEIHANRGVWKDNVFRVHPYLAEGVSHGCKDTTCKQWQCKGKVITDKISEFESQGKEVRAIYIGDGGNDICPGKKLQEKDALMVRNDESLKFGLKLRNYVKEKGIDEFKCDVVHWTTAKEIEDVVDAKF